MRDRPIFSRTHGPISISTCSLSCLCTHIISKARARGYKTFFMLNSIEHEICPAHNVKMPTIVGILTCMSGKNNILGLNEP